jgi:phage host-nuclease inhibitor protein Gam
MEQEGGLMAKTTATICEGVDLREQADGLLRKLLWLKAVEGQMETDANAEMEALAARYRDQLSRTQQSIRDKEAELQKLMKAGRSVFFAAGDVCLLASGSLLRQVENKVRIHGKKDEVVGRLEAAGFHEAVKVEKTFDRDLINTWNDMKLGLIGAERKAVETFNYDLKKTS